MKLKNEIGVEDDDNRNNLPLHFYWGAQRFSGSITRMYSDKGH